MNYIDQTFENERIELHNKIFHGCTFKNCELVYEGDRSPTFTNNKFIDSVFVFQGAAIRTLYFMANIYHAGEGGREVANQIMNDLKEGLIHGKEVKTVAPSTMDHSLG